MKTTKRSSAFIQILWIGLVLGLISCTPRDPEVLSKADKDFISGQKNKQRSGSGSQSKIRPVLPNRVDLSLGLLMMDRESEAVLILNNARALLKAPSEVVQQGCIRTKLISAEANSRVYQISKDLCQFKFDGGKHKVNGTATLRLLTDDQGELLRLQYDTVKLADEGLGVTEYQVSKQDVKMSFVVKDEVHLVIDKKAEGQQYRVTTLQAQSTYRQLVGAVETQGQIFYDGDGNWLMLEGGEMQSQFHAKLRLRAQVMDAGDGREGGDSFFDLVLDSYNQNPAGLIQLQKCRRAQTTYAYNLSFGNNSRQGTLSLAGNELVATSVDPKTKAETKDKLSLSACARRADLAWTELMVLKEP